MKTPNKQNVEQCPACKNKQLVDFWNDCEFIKCTICKHKFFVGKKSNLNKIFALFYYAYNVWIRSNWIKVRTENYGVVISARVIYKSWCWYCWTPIFSIMENGKAIFGNKNCTHPDCNKFICEKCGLCYCDHVRPRHVQKRIRKKWIQQH